jgi:uncharacterized membrane protein YeaQ/YmgE (transglycosylase-associated protein family)
MGLLDFIILLIIAGVCGSLGGAIAGTRRGCFASVALGFIGALVGVVLSRLLRLPELIHIDGFPVVWSIAGAALFMAVINLLSRGRQD